MARHRHRAVTLLNVTYDPLSRISLDHAISLIVMGKAEVFDYIPDEFIQGPVRADGTRMRVPVPIMVILREYANVPYDAIAPLDDVQATRMAILHRDGFICQYRNFMRRVTDGDGHVIHDQNENEVWERTLLDDPEGVWKTCGAPAATWDHVLPQSRGGGNLWLNLVAACGPCNFHKGDRTPDEANMILVRNPFVPEHDRYARERKDVWKILNGQAELSSSEV
jgi:5-methylcytosine-specific restriction endonuclease McrA